MRFASYAAALLMLAPAAHAAAPATAATPGANTQTSTLKLKLGDKMDMKKAPTYIKSESLTLNSKDRNFSYLGNVEVRHGDMTMTCTRIDGTYNEKNQIEQLIAKENVFITSGQIKAQSQKATYDSKSETVLLSDNPELQQEGSILSADTITIYLQEDRSVAQGQVRVKLVRKAEEGEKDPLSTIIKK